MATQIVADILIETLEKIGVNRIYGVVGDSLNAMTNALSNRKKIEWIHTRHEEAAAFAAGAEAQITGKLAVCAGSCGPGNLHLINGLYDAHRSGAPVLAIAAQIPSTEIGNNYFQETDPKALFKDCSYFCENVSYPEALPTLLHTAIQTAITKKGVAVLVISGDIALKEIEAAAIRAISNTPEPIITPNQQELKIAADILNGSEKITLFCGAGTKGAHDIVVQLAERLKSPIVHTLRGKEFIEYDNPFDLGMTGLIGFSSGYYAMEDCDTLVLLGTSFPYRAFYPEKAKIIQIDINPVKLGVKTKIDLGLVGDVKNTVEALLPLLNKKNDTSFLNKALKHYQEARKGLDELAVGEPGKKPIYPQYLAKILNETASEDAIFTCDVGTQTAWAARYLKMNGKRRLVGSFNHGSMANALSQAMGAQCVDKDRQVIAMCGDGGFAMLMGEILTLTQEQMPVKVIVLNNSTLGFVQLEMMANAMVPYGVELKNPNFAKLAEAVGIKGMRIEDPADIKNGLQEAFNHNGPVIIDVVSNTYELIMPPSIKESQAKDFSLFALKAIMSSKGDMLMEVLKTNLWK
jgi:thiamine pyrophosphate-dependent acetolactate synthase large subunit-like protein